MARPKLRGDEVKSLLRQTFPNRWDAFINGEPPENTLTTYLASFPVLKKIAYVSFSAQAASQHVCLCKI